VGGLSPGGGLCEGLLPEALPRPQLAQVAARPRLAAVLPLVLRQGPRENQIKARGRAALLVDWTDTHVDST
jgi:hypothetical protein